MAHFTLQLPAALPLALGFPFPPAQVCRHSSPSAAHCPLNRGQFPKEQLASQN